jgi:hypothetical protein
VKRVCRILILALLLASCATAYQPTYYYNQIVIQNTANVLLREVSLSSGDGGRSFSCSNIAPKGICSDRFPRRQYMNVPIQVSWALGNSAVASTEILLEWPGRFSSGSSFPLRGIVEVGPQGSISAYFEQDVKK